MVTVVVMGGVVECTGRVNFLLKNFVPPKIRKDTRVVFYYVCTRQLSRAIRFGRTSDIPFTFRGNGGEQLKTDDPFKLPAPAGRVARQ